MGIVIRQSFKGTIITYVGAFVGFLTTFFVSVGFLTAEEIGLTRALMDAGILISSFALMGISVSAPKFFPYFKNQKENHNGFFFYLVAFAFLGITLAFAIALLAREMIMSYFSEAAALFVDYFYLIFPLAFFLVYQTVFEAYSAVLMRIVIPRFVREILIRLMTITVFLLYAFDFIGLDLMIYLYVAEYGVAALINLFYVSRIGTVSLAHNTSYVRKPLQRYVFRFTGYMMVTTFGIELVNKVGTFMIASSMGLDFTGIYSIAFFMAAIVEIPSRSLSSISVPLLASHIKEKNHVEAENLLKRVTLNQFLVGSLIFVLLWANIDNIFDIMPKGDTDYAQGKWVVFFLGLARLCDLLGNFSVATLNVSKHYYVLFVILLITAMTITGNYLLIPVLGITGAPVSMLISLFVYYLIVLIFVNVKLKYNPLSKNLLKVLALTGGVLLIDYFFITLNNPILDGIARTFVLGGLFVLTLYFWKISDDINNLIRNILKRVRALIVRDK